MTILQDLIELESGYNVSRVTDVPREWVYSVNDLEEDLAGSREAVALPTEPPSRLEAYCLKEGDLVISLIAEKAGIVGKGNAGKLLSSNFVRCSRINPEMIDKWWLCFYINKSEAFRRSAGLRTGFAGLALYHLSPTFLRSVPIEPPPIERQRQIGSIYRDYCRLNGLYERQKNEIERYVMSLLNKKNQKGE